MKGILETATGRNALAAITEGMNEFHRLSELPTATSVPPTGFAVEGVTAPLLWMVYILRCQIKHLSLITKK